LLGNTEYKPFTSNSFECLYATEIGHASEFLRIPDLTLSHLIHEVTKENESVNIRNHNSGYVMSHIIARDDREDYVTKNFKIFIIQAIILSVRVDDLEKARTRSTHGGGVINM